MFYSFIINIIIIIILNHIEQLLNVTNPLMNVLVIYLSKVYRLPMSIGITEFFGLTCSVAQWVRVPKLRISQTPASQSLAPGKCDLEYRGQASW